MADEGDSLQIKRDLSIPLRELSWKFSASGGPGGQHANTANTRVELRFDLDGSQSLTDWQRHRLRARFGDEVRVVVSAERSQARNRSIALSRLTELLSDALRVRPPRRPTRATKGSQQRRLQDKSRRSTVKQQRRRPSME